MIVDVHAHYIPKCLFERFPGEARAFPSVVLKGDGGSFRMQFPGGEMTRPISPKLSDLRERTAWMDANGIDHQLVGGRSEEHTSELQSLRHLVCRLLLEKKKQRSRQHVNNEM